MKLTYKILSLVLAFSFCLSPVYAFGDIPNETVNLAALSLSSLGIVNGSGGNNYSPNRNLTRAEFSKLAVLALGDNTYESYASYTIFPDVRNTHWAAAYINSAVKQHKIIKGNADGTFKPDNTINLGEACTILLSMLGYKTEDIGPGWPMDYIAKCRAIGLLENVAATASTAPISRGDAAVLVKNLLLTAKKGGDILLRTTFTKVNGDSILIATSETDSSLEKNKAAFYEGGQKIIRDTMKNIPKELVGSRGYAVFDKNEAAKILGFVHSSGKSDSFVVTKAYNDKLETKIGTVLKPKNETVVILNGEKLDFSTAWFDILPDNKITVYYSEGGEIDIIVVVNEATTANTFVYTSGSIPAGYKVIKNGVLVNQSAVVAYDVVSLNPSLQTAFVTDNKITGYYDKGGPSYTNPTSVSVLGKEFRVPSSAAKYFKNLTIGDRITLLLTSSGAVVAAYPSTTINATMTGILTEIKGETATVQLLNGMKIERKISSSVGTLTSGGANYSNAWSFYRKLVNVNIYKDESIGFTEAPISKKAGDWTLSEGKLGTAQVLPNVSIFERAYAGAPLEAITLGDVTDKVVPNSAIASCMTDNAGNIRAIILENVTGLSVNLGIPYTSKKIGSDPIDDKDTSTFDLYTVELKTAKNTYTYEIPASNNINAGVPNGIPKYLENIPYRNHITTQRLENLGSVKRDAFVYSDSVKVNGSTYALLEDVPVYLSKNASYISLREAKANYSDFTLYSNKAAGNGGKVCFIIAK